MKKTQIFCQTFGEICGRSKLPQKWQVQRILSSHSLLSLTIMQSDAFQHFCNELNVLNDSSDSVNHVDKHSCLKSPEYMRIRDLIKQDTKEGLRKRE